VAIIVIAALAIVFDLVWKRVRGPAPPSAAAAAPTPGD